MTAATTTRAVSLRNGKLALRTLPVPAPGEGQMLVKTLACGICASDHHSMDHPEVALADRSGMSVHDPAPLVGEVVPLEGLADAFERARSSGAPVRIVYRA